MKTVQKARNTKASLSETCDCFGLKLDAFYKYQKRSVKRQMVVSKVVKLVRQERKDLPRVGTRKLYKLLQPMLEEELKIGRDKLFDMLREQKMLLNYITIKDFIYL